MKRLLQNYMYHDISIIITSTLGHLIYQMASKKSLLEERIFPTDYDYEILEDEIQDVIRHIFKIAKKRKKSRVLMMEVLLLL